MKKELVQGFIFASIVCLFWSFTSCNSASKNQSNEEPAFNQEAFNAQLQGVFEYLPPNQGMAAMFGDKFIFVFGASDTTMICQMGTYTTTGNLVEFTTQYATEPELEGSVIKWSPVFMDNDSMKTIIFDDNGNITNEFYNKRNVKVDKQMLSQLEKFEGVYNYASFNGGGILLSGYGVFLSSSSGGAGTYEYKNDTVTFKRLFTTNPAYLGGKTTWVNEGRIGDTLNWATINSAGEINNRGKSIYLK